MLNKRLFNSNTQTI